MTQSAPLFANPEISGKFRDQIAGDGIPAWLKGPNAQRLLYAMAVQYDALADAATLAVFYGLATYVPPNPVEVPPITTPDGIIWAGLDRNILQGYQESRASYVARLVQWLDRWPYAGKATGVLMAVRGWILPQMPNVISIKDSPGGDAAINGGDSLTTWTSYTDGTDPMPAGATTVTPPAIAQVHPRNFNWDGNYPAPIRVKRAFIVVFATATSWITSSGTWGSSGKKWGDPSKSWGVSVPQSRMTGLRGAVRIMKSSGTWYQWIIVTFDSTLFDQTQPADNVHNPDGTFGRWSKIVNGKYVRARFTGARYANGWGWPGGT
jgi:hypothetical protein